MPRNDRAPQGLEQRELTKGKQRFSFKQPNVEGQARPKDVAAGPTCQAAPGSHGSFAFGTESLEISKKKLVVRSFTTIFVLARVYPVDTYAGRAAGIDLAGADPRR